MRRCISNTSAQSWPPTPSSSQLAYGAQLMQQHNSSQPTRSERKQTNSSSCTARPRSPMDGSGNPSVHHFCSKQLLQQLADPLSPQKHKQKMQNLIHGGSGISLWACLHPELTPPPVFINFTWVKDNHLVTDLIVKVCGIFPQFMFPDECSVQ